MYVFRVKEHMDVDVVALTDLNDDGVMDDVQVVVFGHDDVVKVINTQEEATFDIYDSNSRKLMFIAIIYVGIAWVYLGHTGGKLRFKKEEKGYGLDRGDVVKFANLVYVVSEVSDSKVTYAQAKQEFMVWVLGFMVWFRKMIWSELTHWMKIWTQIQVIMNIHLTYLHQLLNKLVLLMG